jgi:hypothetical protein
VYFDFDTLGDVFFCSKDNNKYWNRVSEQIKSDITIFIGQTFDIREVMSSIRITSRKGINILASCSTNDYAKTLNRELNKDGKYFIGFKDTIHFYGTSFLTCHGGIHLNKDDFFEQFDNTFRSDSPIVKLIKIFFSESVKQCGECRKCNIITSAQIQEKLLAVMAKVMKAESFSEKDSYFNSDFHTICSKTKCEPDRAFEIFFSERIDAFERMEIEKAEADKKARELEEKALAEQARLKRNEFRNNFMKHVNTNSEIDKDDAKKWFETSLTSGWVSIEAVIRAYADHVQPDNESYEFVPNNE